VTGRPVFPLSREKTILVPVSLCPRTRVGANVLGQAPLSLEVPEQNVFQSFKINTKFPVLGHNFPVSEHSFPVVEQRFLF
jgi:hypothetical protein